MDTTGLDCRVSLKYTETEHIKLVTTRVFITRKCLEAYWKLLRNTNKFQSTASAGEIYFIFFLFQYSD
jgi:hypothetical protein